MPPTKPVPMIIDTDCGIDDAVALWWAALSPDVELLGVTTVHGNVTVSDAAVNTCRIMDASGRSDVEVTIGAAASWGPAPPLRRADFIHGADGIANLGWPAPPISPTNEHSIDMLRRIVDGRPGEVTIVTLGPMANIAAVVDADPSWPSRVKRLVVMGGTVLSPGNAMPTGEANIANDPFAAQISLSADWREPPLMVGLDITQAATLTLDEIALAREHRTPAAEYLAELLAFYQPFGGTFCAPGAFPCHDALATMLAVFPERATGSVLPTAVETGSGPAQGMTVVDRRQPFFAKSGQAQAMPPGFYPVEVLFEVDAAWFRSEVRALLGD
ncbi:MAG: nucleoside hydrolase [Ilumatobacteraceae bacterium]